MVAPAQGEWGGTAMGEGIQARAVDGAPRRALRDGRQLRRTIAHEIGMQRSRGDHEQRADEQAERKDDATGEHGPNLALPERGAILAACS